MKSIKFVGILFAITGFVFIIVGSIGYFLTYIYVDERIYTIATIVKIDEIKTNDSENPKEFIVYVEFESDGEMIISKLNTYSSKYRLKDKIDVYYFSDNIEMVYTKGSEHLLLLFPIIGLIVFIVGIILFFNKKSTNVSFKNSFL